MADITPPSTYGTPGTDAQYYDGQQAINDCAIDTQKDIIQEFTGQHIDEMTLVQEAQAHGWAQQDGGTSPQDVGKLLQLHGIGVHQQDHASIADVEAELSQGHKVMVAVASGALWPGQQPSGQADHVLEVTGVDTSDPNNPQVIVIDTGEQGWHGEDRYPLSQFLSAWHTSNLDCSMWATDAAPAGQSSGTDPYSFNGGASSLPGGGATDPHAPADPHTTTDPGMDWQHLTPDHISQLVDSAAGHVEGYTDSLEQELDHLLHVA